MQLHVSPSLRHMTVVPGKGVRDFIKLKVASRRISYRTLFYSLLLLTFLIRFVFVLTAVDSIDGGRKCSTLGCIGKRLGPKILRTLDPTVPEAVYRILKKPMEEEEMEKLSGVAESLAEFADEQKHKRSDITTFAMNLRAMVTMLERRLRTTKIQEYLYRHVASSSIPKQLHCLTLKLAAEHATNAAARLQLPPAEMVPRLTNNSFLHFVLASDNVLAASVVARSLVQNSITPEKIVVHIITDRKTYFPMQAWFSLHRLSPAVVEVKPLHRFDWLTKAKVPVLEAMEKDRTVRSRFRRGSSAIVANSTEKPYVIASKLQALNPKYNSVMNHIRIQLPELFPNLEKVVFLDDDVVVQTDLSPLWDIDMEGKVNGAVATCRGDDRFVMSKRLKSYLNFSHPLIDRRFDPEECAWAYGMNVFDLDAWRKTNVSLTYHYWLEQNVKSELSLWQLGTLPPALIAFHGHVRIIDSSWHMLGLGYQENTSMAEAKAAAVVHFNGRAKPWLDIAFPTLRILWSKYVPFHDRFIKACRISPS